jgi:hypothetical protein
MTTTGHRSTTTREPSRYSVLLSGVDLTPEEGALFMVAVKLSRLRHNIDDEAVHRDSLVDAAGYLWVFASIAEARGKMRIR